MPNGKRIFNFGSLANMKTTSHTCLLIFLLVIQSCTKQAGGFDVDAYKKEIGQWHQTRLARLTRDDGWLTLCGLFWLKEGENLFGTDSSNAVIFPPGKSPGIAGS